MNKIRTSLWCNGTAEEQMNYYLSVFKDAEQQEISYYADGMGDMSGKVLTANFRLHDMEFVAINAGPEFPYSEAISFMVNCKDQEGVDYFWNTFVNDGGEESMCGWLKDKYGLSWQIVPEQLGELMQNPDPEAASRVGQALMKMREIDLAALEAAANGQ